MSSASDEDSRRALGELPDWVEERVLSILEGEPERQEADLAELLADCPEHADTVRSWLARAEGDEASAPELEVEKIRTPASRVPDRIGPYRIGRVLGKGGFGTVYLGMQDEPFERKVALKLINPGMDSGEILARFAGEREALNRMQHPGIAQLLDAGETDEGRPYFVMEYVEGVPLHRFVRDKGFDIEQRIRLFLQVLEAVQHAHQKAVIHRDLSHNNVLVTEIDGRPQPKIIDFGIAKSLTVPLAAANTFVGQFMGTPEFMSPEQAMGANPDIDTRTDIYALGVQLYELLTDTMPIPSEMLRGKELPALCTVILDYQPPRPSQRVPKHLSPPLRGDLDWITMKAMAKDRELRYPSASELAADLRRYLEDEPVTAGPPSTAYRLKKFVRRYRVQVLAGLVVVLGLLASLAVSLVSLERTKRAEQEAIEARELAEQKADAGFNLLANIERLEKALDIEAELYPPWPEKAGAMRQWIDELALPLIEELPKMQAKLDELQRAAGDEELEGPERHLFDSLTRLEADVRSFTAPGGPMESVRARLAWAERVDELSIEEHAEVWQRAAEAVRASDDALASKEYKGLPLEPQTGLVPLGMNPHTRLWEFVHLRSGAADAPLPVRDAATGRLVVGPEHGIVFVLIPGGEFWMGARRDEGMQNYDPWSQEDEQPLHTVLLEPFFLSRYELTQEQWSRLTGGDTPSRSSGAAMLPVENVDWNRAREALQRFALGLPTEAQWEYACRARSKTPWYCASTPEELSACGHFGEGPLPVGQLQPNDFGLFDMHGNVAEWCRDWFGPYTAEHRTGDGLRLLEQGEGRVVRGGKFDGERLQARSAARAWREPSARDESLGVRVVRPILR